MTLYIYSKDVDKLWKQAVAAGARATIPFDDQYWGERYGQLVTRLGTVGPFQYR